MEREIDWSQVVYEDQQFWAWAHFSLSHASQGKFSEVLDFLEDLREILQSWQQKIENMSHLICRKSESQTSSYFTETFEKTFCEPHAEGIREALGHLIQLQLSQRAAIERSLKPKWQVSAPTISKIQSFTRSF